MARCRFVLSTLLAASLACSCLTGCGLFRRTDREADLRNDLTTMRLAIEEYARDRDQLPYTLQELVDAKYLKEIPIYPMTRRHDWQLNFDPDAVESKQGVRGIVSVHSNSSTIGSNGLPYSSWVRAGTGTGTHLCRERQHTNSLHLVDLFETPGCVCYGCFVAGENTFSGGIRFPAWRRSFLPAASIR